MEILPPFSVLYPYLISLTAAGLVSGFLAGLFGVGGGAILVPVFYQVLGVLGVDEAINMHIAIGSALAITVPTSLQSFTKHRAKGAVDIDLLKSFIFSVPAGVVCAAIVTIFISGTNLRLIFAVIALAVAMKMFFAKTDWKLGDDIPANPVRAIVGWLIGFLSTFMGIGGGVFNNTFMSLFGRNIHQSVATSAGVGVLVSIPGMLGYMWAGWGVAGLPPLSLGFVNLLIVATVIPITIFTAPLGVRFAHKLSKKQIEKAFGVFLVLVSMRFFASLL